MHFFYIQLLTFQVVIARHVYWNEIEIERYPYLVQVRKAGEMIAEGALVADKFVLTVPQELTAGRISVYFGTHIWDSGGIEIFVQFLIPHVRWNKDTFENCNSLMKLEKAVTFSPRVGIGLITYEFADHRIKYVVAGWAKGQPDPFLRQRIVEIRRHDWDSDCDPWGHYKTNMCCIQNQPQQMLGHKCMPGTMLIEAENNFVIQGIVIAGHGNNTICLRVLNYSYWIHNTIDFYSDKTTTSNPNSKPTKKKKTTPNNKKIIKSKAFSPSGGEITSPLYVYVLLLCFISN